MNESVRLLKLLIGLSGATDLGMGLKVGEPVRSAALGAGLARAFELDDEGNREALHATLLTEAVCVGPPSGQGGRLSIRRCASPTQTSVNHGAKRPRNRPKAAEGALAPRGPPGDVGALLLYRNDRVVPGPHGRAAMPASASISSPPRWTTAIYVALSCPRERRPSGCRRTPPALGNRYEDRFGLTARKPVDGSPGQRRNTRATQTCSRRPQKRQKRPRSPLAHEEFKPNRARATLTAQTAPATTQ
jgi:hypothetical protein